MVTGDVVPGLFLARVGVIGAGVLIRKIEQETPIEDDKDTGGSDDA